MVAVPGVMTGMGTNVKPEASAVSVDYMTVIEPLLPSPTTALMLVSESIVNDWAGTPPKRTSVVPENLLPEIVTVVPL